LAANDDYAALCMPCRDDLAIVSLDGERQAEDTVASLDHLDEAGVDAHVLDGGVEVELDALEKPWLVVLPILILGVLQAGWQVWNTGASTLDDVVGRSRGCGPRYSLQEAAQHLVI